MCYLGFRLIKKQTNGQDEDDDEEAEKEEQQQLRRHNSNSRTEYASGLVVIKRSLRGRSTRSFSRGAIMGL